MRSLILVGDKSSNLAYVEKYIQENKILAYNIFRFLESLKIADAREIKQILSRKSVNQGKRIIVIEDDPTIEAQNALLKTIEEIPDDSAIIFISPRNLLPTIFSRCSIVKTGIDENMDQKEIQLDIAGDNIYDFLLVVDSVFSSKAEDGYEKLILVLRRSLMLSLRDGKGETIHLTYKLLKEFIDNLPLVVSNNLNQRVTAEKNIIRVFN